MMFDCTNSGFSDMILILELFIYCLNIDRETQRNIFYNEATGKCLYFEGKWNVSYLQVVLLTCLACVSLQNPVIKTEESEGRSISSGMITLDGSIILPLLLAGAAFAKATFIFYFLDKNVIFVYRVTCLETFTTASTMLGTIEVLDIHITTMTFTVEELAKV